MKWIACFLALLPSRASATCLATLEEVEQVVVVPRGEGGDLLLAGRVGGVRIGLVGVQRVVDVHVNEPHPLAVRPLAATLNFHPPVVIAVTNTVGPKAGDLLLLGDRGGEPTV